MYYAGVGGETVPSLRARFARDMLARKPQVVILKTGIMDYIVEMPPDTFRPQRRAAIGELQGAGIDVVLLDARWYPGPGARERDRQFQAVIRAEGGARGLPVVRRSAWTPDMWTRRI